MDHQLLSTPIAVVRVLGRIADGRTLVEVHLDGATRAYQSAIIGLHRGRGELWLDELVPREPQPVVPRGTRLQVRGRHDGVRFSFDAPLIAAGVERGIAFYRLRIPERVHYSQRRADYRAPVPESISLEVLLERDEAQALHGVLRDLSAGGCCLRVEAQHLDAQLGESHCTLLVPQEARVRFRLEPRHIELTRPGLWLIGGRYSELGRRDRRAIEHLIARLERDLARRGQG